LKTFKKSRTGVSVLEVISNRAECCVWMEVCLFVPRHGGHASSNTKMAGRFCKQSFTKWHYSNRKAYVNM